MKLLIWGLVMLAVFILGLLVDIGGGVYMFLWAALVLIIIGSMKLSHRRA
ncbi:hypothetical protein [Sinomonas atrocyanea]|jgi:hypothetical protein|nr:hypothetical protein [Sinomonas atrocyanea]MDQ0260502.1 glucose dehydrogenase [Sinomonas atrocyanea]MDR6621494.1 glucose dehydrogenase [Sinomonas atrocyanea]